MDYPCFDQDATCPQVVSFLDLANDDFPRLLGLWHRVPEAGFQWGANVLMADFHVALHMMKRTLQSYVLHFLKEAEDGLAGLVSHGRCRHDATF